MKLRDRISILTELGTYMGSSASGWMQAKARAAEENPWFLPEFIDLAVNNIRDNFLDPGLLNDWAEKNQIPDQQGHPKTIGLVMAGNIPLVGFHDFLCCFISGHRQKIKMSSRDAILLEHLVDWLHLNLPDTKDFIELSGMLKNCDAYIATGSDNSSRYFEQYFARFPHIIRKNRTSVAILDGTESTEDLDKLADDIQLYFGLGCRNITQIHVPEGYDFVPILQALRKYAYFMDQHKYKHNFDYNLTIQIMNNRYYMTNDAVLLSENPAPFSPISQVNYQFYSSADKLTDSLNNEKIQCIVGKGFTPFGQAQKPGLNDYPDGVNTLQFILAL